MCAICLKFSPVFYVAEQKDKTEPFDVEEVVQEMPRDQRGALWVQLASLLHDVLLDLPPDRWEQGEEEGMEVESNADPVSCHVPIIAIFINIIFRLHTWEKQVLSDLCLFCTAGLF